MPAVNKVLLDRARQMRSNGSPIEAMLWGRLRNKRLNGIKFARQVVIEPYIVDFVARSHGLVVELDGDTHGESQDYDERRTVSGVGGIPYHTFRQHRCDAEYGGDSGSHIVRDRFSPSP